MYFMPQSGAITSRSAGMYFSALRMRSATASGASIVMVAEIDHAQDDGLGRDVLEHRQVKFRLGRLDRNLIGLGRFQFLEEFVLRRLVLHHMSVAEAEMNGDLARDAFNRLLSALMP